MVLAPPCFLHSSADDSAFSSIPPELGRLMAKWAADPALQMSFFSQIEPMSNTMIQQIREEEKEEDEEEEEEEHPHQPSARDGTVSAHRGTARAVIATSGSSAVSSALATHLQAFDRYKVPLHSYEEYLSEQVCVSFFFHPFYSSSSNTACCNSLA